MHILGKGLNWKVPKEEDSEEEDDEEAEMDKDEAEREGNPGSSGLSTIDMKLDIVLQKLAENQIQLRTIIYKQEGLVQCHNSLCYYVAEHYKWEETFLAKLAADLKCSSEFEPPPRCPFIPRPSNFVDPTPPPPPPPPFTSDKGKEKVYDPPPLTQDTVDTSIEDVLKSMRDLESVEISDDEENMRAAEDFIVSPAHGDEAVGAVPEGELGRAIVDIDREGAVDAANAPVQATSPSISAEFDE